MSERIRDAGYPQAYECYRFDSAAMPRLFPVKPQSHYFSEIILVRSGICRVTRGSYVYALKPGELLYIGPLIRHAVDSEDGNPVVFDVVKFSATRLNELPSYLADLRALSIDVALLPIENKTVTFTATRKGSTDTYTCTKSNVTLEKGKFYRNLGTITLVRQNAN